MKEILSIVNQLQGESSKNGKAAILKQHEANGQWKKFLKYVLDTNHTFGIQEKKLKKFLGESSGINTFISVFEVFDFLLDNNTGSDSTVNKVALFIDSEPEHLTQFYIESITKKLRLGISVKTVSKAYPDLIEIFELQRAKSYHDYKDKLKGKPYSIGEKMNGIRCTTIKRGNVIINKTRQNKIIYGLNGINSEFINLPDGVYDGELVVKNYEQYKLRDVLQETMRIVNSDSDNKIVDYWIFDYMTEEEFNDKQSKLNYFERRDTNPVNGHKGDSVKIIPEIYRGTDESMVEKYLNEFVSRGREGLMYYKDMKYESKKTSNILKVKKKYSSDLKVIGFEEGNGKYKGMLGALVFDYKGFSLGCSGMSNEQRIDIWANKEKYLGALAEIEHEQESSNEKGGVSVEYPSFVRWRFDKDEISYAHE